MKTQQIVDYLNLLLKLDPNMINVLFTNRVKCNDAVLEDSDLFVRKEEDGYSTSVIGIINTIQNFSGEPIISMITCEGGSEILGFDIYTNEV